jgi:hypothetical protein
MFKRHVKQDLYIVYNKLNQIKLTAQVSTHIQQQLL